MLLDDGGLAARTVVIGADGITEVAPRPYPRVPTYQADGLLVLPGIVDLHGDGFERSVMPRPGIAFALPMALVETLRWETSNLAAEQQILAWIADGKVDLLAFNDHINDLLDSLPDQGKLGRLAGRCGISPEEYRALVQRAVADRDRAPAAIARLAEAARRSGIPVAAHDNNSPDDWAASPSPSAASAVSKSAGNSHIVQPSAREAAQSSGLLLSCAATVMGAPNVLRGGSHCGRLSVADAVRASRCTALTTDYYYPALIQAAFHLAQDEGALPDIWPLLSSGPANAAGLRDRGRICAGLRADLVLVDTRRSPFPQVVGTFVDGMLAFAARALHASAEWPIDRGLTAAQ